MSEFIRNDIGRIITDSNGYDTSKDFWADVVTSIRKYGVGSRDKDGSHFTGPSNQDPFLGNLNVLYRKHGW